MPPDTITRMIAACIIKGLGRPGDTTSPVEGNDIGLGVAKPENRFPTLYAPAIARNAIIPGTTKLDAAAITSASAMPNFDCNICTVASQAKLLNAHLSTPNNKMAKIELSRA